MKARLIKINGDMYVLHNDVTGKKISDTDRMLSLKNCQAIERGYDLDAIIENNTNEYITTNIRKFNYGFEKGFQKALEILGDRRFTEEDMRKAVSRARMCSVIDEYGSVRFHEGDVEIIQSLQQNEWEVEIIMECTQCQSYGYVSECRDNCNKKFLQPKLDAEGCLILKRVV